MTALEYVGTLDRPNRTGDARETVSYVAARSTTADGTKTQRARAPRNSKSDTRSARRAERTRGPARSQHEPERDLSLSLSLSRVTIVLVACVSQDLKIVRRKGSLSLSPLGERSRFSRARAPRLVKRLRLRASRERFGERVFARSGGRARETPPVLARRRGDRAAARERSLLRVPAPAPAATRSLSHLLRAMRTVERSSRDSFVPKESTISHRHKRSSLSAVPPRCSGRRPRPAWRRPAHTSATPATARAHRVDPYLAFRFVAS